jgi:hypothetical protein
MRRLEIVGLWLLLDPLSAVVAVAKTVCRLMGWGVSW